MKYYAIIGESACTYDNTKTPKCPDGHIEMQGPPPSAEYLAQADGTWAIPVPTLEELKAAKLAEIVTARNNAIDKEGAEHKGLRFWADKGSKSDILFAIMAYEKTGHLEPMWKAMDGIMPIESADDLMGIAEAIGLHVAAQYATEFALAELVKAAETAEELDAIEVEFYVLVRARTE